jgi:hypothetical protein
MSVHSRPTTEDHERSGLGDERRDSLRITDELLLDYRLEGEPDEAAISKRERVSDEAIATFFAKPAADLLTHANAGDGDAQLAQWLMKIDWALEMILRTLARMSPDGIQLPSLTEVNISAGGLRFAAAREFREADTLEISLVLPPFTPILAKAEVTRVIPDEAGGRRYNIAARFTSISPEDRERLIRHILLLQAERIRSRQGQVA